MTIQDLLQMAQNQLATLQGSQQAAFNSGNLDLYTSLTNQITAQQVLVDQLQSAVGNLSK